MRKVRTILVVGVLCFLIAGAVETGLGLKINEEQGNPEKAHVSLNKTTVDHSALMIIKKNVKDIYKGDLIVVNNDTPYQFNGDKTLASVYDNKDTNYFVKDKNVMLDREVFPALNAMMDDFYKKTNVKEINIVSGYRTKEYQQKLYQQNVDENGTVYTMSYVANAGCSEHHTGLAMDLGCFNPKDKSSASFTGKNELKWFSENAHCYGFILRYPESKKNLTGISYEPWHFRYVGVPHSYVINQMGFCLEEYIDYIKENSKEDKHINVDVYGKKYEIYYTKNKEIKVPKNKAYTISGDNKEGFIVTITI